MRTRSDAFVIPLFSDATRHRRVSGSERRARGLEVVLRVGMGSSCPTKAVEMKKVRA